MDRVDEKYAFFLTKLLLLLVTFVSSFHYEKKFVTM
ncbi:hypothetical protein IIM_02203 [Bacillus cereus VD107]|nr:hypothetical protein IIM_02203 [Bacillus cereus VD107]